MIRRAKLMIICCAWVCLPCHYAHYKKKIAKLEEVKELAKLRRNASGHDVRIDLPDILEERMNNNIRNREKFKAYGYYDDSAYYTDAVSCGASADGGFYTGGGGFHVGRGTEVAKGNGFVEILHNCLWDGRAFSGREDGGKGRGNFGGRGFQPQGPFGPYGTFNYCFCEGIDVGGGYDIDCCDEGDADGGDCDGGDCDAGGDCDGGDCGGDD